MPCAMDYNFVRTKPARRSSLVHTRLPCEKNYRQNSTCTDKRLENASVDRGKPLRSDPFPPFHQTRKIFTMGLASLELLLNEELLSTGAGRGGGAHGPRKRLHRADLWRGATGVPQQQQPPRRVCLLVATCNSTGACWERGASRLLQRL